MSRIILVKTLIIDFFKFDKISYNLSRLDMRMEVEYPQEVDIVIVDNFLFKMEPYVRR